MKRAWRLFRFATLMFGVAIVEGVLEAVAHEWMLSRRCKRYDEAQRAYDANWSRR